MQRRYSNSNSNIAIAIAPKPAINDLDLNSFEDIILIAGIERCVVRVHASINLPIRNSIYYIYLPYI